MGPGFVLLFYILIVGAFGVIAIGLASLAFLGWRKKWNWLKWLAGIPAAGMTLLTLAMIIGVFAMLFETKAPSDVFNLVFNQRPETVTATNVQSKFHWFADEGHVYLSFQIPPDQFQKLVPKGLAVKTALQLQGKGLTTGPDWWTFKLDGRWIYYFSEFERRSSVTSESNVGPKGFSSEIECFAYDPETRTAYYHFLGID